MSEAHKFTGKYHPDALQHMKRIEVLFDVLKGKVLERSDDLLQSGAIDLDKYDPDNYALSKIVITAVLNDVKDAFIPFRNADKEEVRNLQNF